MYVCMHMQDVRSKEWKCMYVDNSLTAATPTPACIRAFLAEPIEKAYTYNHFYAYIHTYIDSYMHTYIHTA